MQNQALGAGLAIDPGAGPALRADNYLGPIYDSYRAFLDGVYAQTHPEYFRPIDLSPASTQTIDGSVLARKGAVPTYNPQNAGFPVVEQRIA
jgi:hypothetical protein